MLLDFKPTIKVAVKKKFKAIMIGYSYSSDKKSRLPPTIKVLL
jgi:hypothetical protein